MIKIKNSFLAFSSEYNTQRKSKEEVKPNLRGDAKDMDRFLRTSSFTNRRDPTPPININIQAKSAIKQSYYFKEDRPRFKYDGNRNQLLFGQMQSPLRTEEYDKQKSKLEKSYHIEPVQYEQKATSPKSIRDELQQTLLEQKNFKQQKQHFAYLSQQKRIIQNLHRDQIEKVQRRPNFQLYKNSNDSFEFYNQKIEPKMNANYLLCSDWQSKRQSNNYQENTFNNVISQVPVFQSRDKFRETNLRYQDTRGRDFNAINFTKF